MTAVNIQHPSWRNASLGLEAEGSEQSTPPSIIFHDDSPSRRVICEERGYFSLPLVKYDIRHLRRVARKFQVMISLINTQLFKTSLTIAEVEPEEGVKLTCSKEARPWRKIKSHSWRKEWLPKGKSPRYNTQLQGAWKITELLGTIVAMVTSWIPNE